MESYKRSVRVGELIQQEISRIILELKRPQLGFITITAVKLTDDLQDCRVFYSVLGSEEEIAANKKLLEESIPAIRHQLAIRLNLRRTPSLFFVFDETLQRANRVFEILEKLRDEEEKKQP
jgi:ribosome-binding factor A